MQSFPMQDLDLRNLTLRDSQLQIVDLQYELFGICLPFYSEEIEDLAGNAVNVRACAAAWLALLSAVDIDSWNHRGRAAEDWNKLPFGTWR